MKDVYSLTQCVAVTIFFGILSGHGAIANSSCGVQRFTEPFSLSQKLVVKEVSDYKFEILQQINNIRDLSRKLNENNFSITFSQDAEVLDSSESSGIGKPSKSSSIALSHSLNFYQQSFKKRLLREQVKLNESQLNQLQFL